MTKGKQVEGEAMGDPVSRSEFEAITTVLNKKLEEMSKTHTEATENLAPKQEEASKKLDLLADMLASMMNTGVEPASKGETSEKRSSQYGNFLSGNPSILKNTSPESMVRLRAAIPGVNIKDLGSNQGMGRSAAPLLANLGPPILEDPVGCERASPQAKGKSPMYGGHQEEINPDYGYFPREMFQGRHQGRKETNYHHRNFTKGPKLHFPEFDGSNIEAWIKKADRYFKLSQTAKSQMVEIATLYFIGRAETWLESSGLGVDEETWESFCVKLKKRFSEHFVYDVISSFHNINQTPP